MSNNNNGDGEAEVHIDLPPPYEASDLPPVFIVTGRNMAVTLQAPPSSGFLKPPSYSETLGAPPKYTEIDAVDHQVETARGEGDGDVSSSVVVERQLANSGTSRISMITVVSTREDPPPYDGAGAPSGLTPQRVVSHISDDQASQVEPPVDAPPSGHSS